MSKSAMEKDGYVGRRVSKKQEKIYKLTTIITRIRSSYRKPQVVGVPIIEQMRGVREIVSGLALPRKER